MNRRVVLAAHGSASGSGRAAFARLVNAVRREARELEVVDAFVDVEHPTVADVLAETCGPRTVVPLLLSADAPLRTAVGAPARLDPRVSVTPPLGPDWVLAEIGVQRLIEAGARSDDSIVLAAGRITDTAAVADLGKAARFLSAVWGGRVHLGLLDGPEGGPDLGIGDAIDIARAYGKRVVVSTHLLTEGRAHEQIAAAGADVVTAPLLNTGPPDPRLVALVVARARSRASSPDFADS